LNKISMATATKVKMDAIFKGRIKSSKLGYKAITFVSKKTS